MQNEAAVSSENTPHLVELAADIVSAYVSNTSVRAEDLPGLINSIHGALQNVGTGGQTAPEKHEAPMSWKKAIKPDYIVSFEDGKHYKSMKRHLTGRGITPQQYREKWGLPGDFPMVAQNYAKARSEMAKKFGLGQGSAARKGKGRKKAA